MAEQLDDGEFWLPSQFLTDDDVIDDFKSDLVSITTSDDDDLRHFDNFSKLRTGSGSPQSTLCGPVSPPKDEVDMKREKSNETLDLLNKAAGEVAKIKIRSEIINKSGGGTGFFDCSNTATKQRQHQQPPPPPQPPLFRPPFYSLPHFRRFPPHMMWGPLPLPQPQLQKRIINDKPKEKPKPNNRPLGLPPSAWPPLPGQAQVQLPEPETKQPEIQPGVGMYVGLQSGSVGTGVFLPRQVTVPVESKKKSDGNTMKTKNNKISQKRTPRPSSKATNNEIRLPLKANNKNDNHINNNNSEIQLPSEWVY